VVKIFPLLVKRQNRELARIGAARDSVDRSSKGDFIDREPELKSLVAAFAKRVAATASKLVY
jgi:hypothetical protein